MFQESFCELYYFLYAKTRYHGLPGTFSCLFRLLLVPSRYYTLNLIFLLNYLCDFGFKKILPWLVFTHHLYLQVMVLMYRSESTR